MLCAEQQFASEEKLPALKKDFTGSDYYRKACRFGGGEVENRLFAYNQQGLYDKYNELLSRASTEEACREAEKLFSSIGDFVGSAQKIEECREKAKKIRYDSAVNKTESAQVINDLRAWGIFILLKPANVSLKPNQIHRACRLRRGRLPASLQAQRQV